MAGAAGYIDARQPRTPNTIDYVVAGIDQYFKNKKAQQDEDEKARNNIAIAMAQTKNLRKARTGESPDFVAGGVGWVQDASSPMTLKDMAEINKMKAETNKLGYDLTPAGIRQKAALAISMDPTIPADQKDEAYRKYLELSMADDPEYQKAQEVLRKKVDAIFSDTTKSGKQKLQQLDSLGLYNQYANDPRLKDASGGNAAKNLFGKYGGVAALGAGAVLSNPGARKAIGTGARVAKDVFKGAVKSYPKLGPVAGNAAVNVGRFAGPIVQGALYGNAAGGMAYDAVDQTSWGHDYNTKLGDAMLKMPGWQRRVMSPWFGIGADPNLYKD